MSLHNAQDDNSNIDNNSGTGINLGNSSVLGSIGQGLEAVALGSIVIDGTDTDPALVGGDFAHNSRDPVAKRVSTKLGGLPDTTLLSGAAVPGLIVGIHKIESIITRKQSTSFRDGDYNLYTGQFVVEPSTVTDTFHKARSSTQYIDTAANANRSNTGKMVYLVGSIPSSRSYDSKR
jgi:hypothetical protein